MTLLRTALLASAMMSAAARLCSAEPAFPVRVLGATNAQQAVSLVLPVALRDPAGAAAFAAAVSRPGDPLYQHFVTPAQFADRFAVSAADYERLRSWATAQGFSLGERNAGRTTVSVMGPAWLVEQVFGVRLLDRMGADERVFHAPDRRPILPDAIRPVVGDVIGLSDEIWQAPLARVRKGAPAVATGGTGVGGAFSPQDLRSAYRISPQPSPTATETVALFEQGGYRERGLTKWLAQYGLTAPPVKPRLVNTPNRQIVSYLIELEALLDIDMVITANQSAKQILVYEDRTDAYPVALLNCLAAMASDNRVQTVSISYGIDEAMAGAAQIKAESVLFQQLAAQGIAVFVASGDQGAYGRTGAGYNVSDPAAQPFVTSLGGTSLFTDNFGNYLAESVWNHLGTRVGGATGGGVSAFWKLPDYQRYGSLGVASANGGSNTRRNVPDLSSVADELTGVSVYTPYFGWVTIGGTSVSSPLVAGIYSLLDNEYRALGLGQIGFFNPLAYALEESGNPFAFDVLTGSNGIAGAGNLPGYTAGAGYDNTTGYGSPEGTVILYTPITARHAGTPPAIVTNVTGSTTATSIKLKWTPSSGAAGYVVWANNDTYLNTSHVVVTTTPETVLTGLILKSIYSVNIAAVNTAATSVTTPQSIDFTTKAH